MAMRYEIRQLGLGEILDQSIKLMKDHFGVLLGITAVLLIPFYLIGGLIQVTMLPELPPNPTPEQRMAAGMAILRVSIPFALLGAYIIAPITNAALVYGIANAYLDKPISVGESYKRAFRRLLPLLGTWLLVGLAIMGGMILCLVPGILAAFWFALATQVVIIEDVAGFAAMRRSKELMAGNIGTIFVLGLLIGVINGGLSFAAAMIPQPYVEAVANAIVISIGTIIASAVFVVFYFSCRCKHEHFDLALLAQSVGAEAPGELTGGPAPEW
jgi:uncharacterized membrane protein (DUF485 family)